MTAWTRQVAKVLLYVGYRRGMVYLRSRTHIPLLLNARRLTGQGAEIGVSQGTFSEQVLRSWKGRQLFSIDPWREYSQEDYRDLTNVRQEIQDTYYAETSRRLARFGKRSCVLRMASADACLKFKEQQLDFVYIDAQHHYEAVKQDISIWYPKVVKGGIVSGHDYVQGDLKEGAFGVKRAVDEFVKLHKLRLHITSDPPFPSWFVFKP